MQKIGETKICMDVEQFLESCEHVECILKYNDQLNDLNL
jgi:hypothetical protein